MRILAVILLCGAAAFNAAGQSATNALVHILSGTRQFAVHGVPLPQPAARPSSFSPQGGVVPVSPLPPSTARPNELIRLDPSFLAVSCERIKLSLLAALDLKDNWRGQISIHVQFTPRTNQPVDIQAAHFDEGWQYRMLLPDEIEEKRLVRAIVHVLLLEMAHRHDPRNQAEIPLWLSEGLTQHLLNSSSMDLTPRPFTHSFRDERRLDALELARAKARMREILTFNELGLPTPDMLTGDKWSQYQVSSELLIAELLRIKGGKPLLNGFIARLPNNLNWQMTFMQAYGRQFRTLLDVEKWWSLCVASAQGLTEAQGWSHADTWAKLDEIMHVSALIRAGTNTLPARANIPMRQLIEYYDYPTQYRTLKLKIGQLKTLAFVASPSLKPLVERCSDALEGYILKRERARAERDNKGAASENFRYFAQQAMSNLAALEQEMEQARNPAVRTQR